jgi:hypothetical protein
MANENKDLNKSEDYLNPPITLSSQEINKLLKTSINN